MVVRGKRRGRDSKECFFFFFSVQGFFVDVENHFSHLPSSFRGRALLALSLSQKNARTLPSRQRTTSCHVESPRRPQMRLLRPRRRRRKKRKSDEQRRECLLLRRPIALPLLRLFGGSSELCSPRPAPRGSRAVPLCPRSDAEARRSQGEGGFFFGRLFY